MLSLSNLSELLAQLQLQHGGSRRRVARRQRKRVISTKDPEWVEDGKG